MCKNTHSDNAGLPGLFNSLASRKEGKFNQAKALKKLKVLWTSIGDNGVICKVAKNFLWSWRKLHSFPVGGKSNSSHKSNFLEKEKPVRFPHLFLLTYRRSLLLLITWSNWRDGENHFSGQGKFQNRSKVDEQWCSCSLE